MPGLRPLFVLGVLLALLLAGGMYLREKIRARPQPVQSPTAHVAAGPATRSTSQPATAPAIVAPRSYMELLAGEYPDYHVTEPLARPLMLAYAGHFVIRDPVYLDRRGCLCITRADAEPIETLLAKAWRQGAILTRQRVVFVHWTINEDGEWAPHLVCRNARGDGYELIDGAGRRSIGEGKGYDWARAFSWEQRIVVPTDVGVSVFTVEQQISESPSPPLADGRQGHAPVEIAFFNGPLAWVPPSKGHAGSTGAVRCVETAWFRLTAEQGWGANLLHLVPLLDGTVLQLIAGEGESVRLKLVAVDPMEEDQKRQIVKLIGQLSDMDPEIRQDAYRKLTQYGPGLWPIAEGMMADADPEAQSRLKDLLKTKMTPLLGGMQLVDGTLRLVSRHPEGGALFYSRRGVFVPRGDEEPQVVAPAWLSIRPGRPIELLHADLVRDLDPDKCGLTPCGQDWIVTDEVNGPRRFAGAGALTPLLRADEGRHWQFVGMDQEGRYVLKGAQAADPWTLIIDPRLPDPRPRLPVWQLVYPAGSVGWDKNDWPAAKQSGAWALGTADWRPIDEKVEPFYTTADQVPPAPRPARAPTTSVIAPDEKPLLADAEGNCYFDGKDALKVIRSDGTQLVWPLPDIAGGDADTDAHLVRTKEGWLFLFNQPGRMLRIKRTAGVAEGYKIDGTFTRRIPNVSHPTRMWLDPFGRICIAYDGNKLAILFPQGYVPSETAQMMTAEQLEEPE